MARKLPAGDVVVGTQLAVVPLAVASAAGAAAAGRGKGAVAAALAVAALAVSLTAAALAATLAAAVLITLAWAQGSHVDEERPLCVLRGARFVWDAVTLRLDEYTAETDDARCEQDCGRESFLLS